MWLGASLFLKKIQGEEGRLENGSVWCFCYLFLFFLNPGGGDLFQATELDLSITCFEASAFRSAIFRDWGSTVDVWVAQKKGPL